MARSVGNQLPAPIRPLFAGTDLERREGLTFLLITTTDDGWPHVALLGVGEVVALGPRRLRIAAWLRSTATANLTRAGRATLALVAEGTAYSVRCSARRQPDLALHESGRLACFELTVEDVLEDVAPYAVLTSGVTYRLKDRERVLPRWREAVEALRTAPAATDPA